MVDFRARRTGDQPADAPREALVLGLGRFGTAVARELTALGFEVLGADSDEARVLALSKEFTHVVQADTADEDVLRDLGAADFTHAVVGIGSDIEASILTTAGLSDLGVGHIVAKAVTEAHGRILARVGAHEVIYPEHEMGRRVAHRVSGSVLDWFQVDETFAIVETQVPTQLDGDTLAGAGLRARFGVTVVAVQRTTEEFTYATPDTLLSEGDILLVAGSNDACEAFARLR